MARKYFAIIPLLFLIVSCSPSRQIKQSSRSLLSHSELKPAHIGIAIFDAAAGKTVFTHQADKFFVPASNTKIISTFAGLKVLKDSIPSMHYEVINARTIKIEPLGDPTFLHRDFPAQPGYQLLKNFDTIQIYNAPFTSFLGNGWAWNDYLYSYSTQRGLFPLYGNVLSVELIDGRPEFTPSYFHKYVYADTARLEGLAIKKPWDSNLFQIEAGKSAGLTTPFTPSPQTFAELLKDTLHRVVSLTDTPLSAEKRTLYSHHLDSVLKPMMHRSDNFFAEQTMLQAGRMLVGSFDETKILDTLSALLFDHLPQAPAWKDGSGLSRYNLFSPMDFVLILDRMQHQFGIGRLQAIFPTGGTGTLTGLYNESGNYIFAKTGTLNGVIALSGYIYSDKGRQYIFSIMVNNHHGSAGAIRKEIEKFLQQVRKKL